MSFTDQLKSLKGLIATKDDDKEARTAPEAEDARAKQAKENAKAEMGRRLLNAGAAVREKGLLNPLPDRRLALLILIIDDLPFELLWREWIRRHDGRTQVKVWIHAKYPERIQSAWVQSRLIKRSFRPDWGSVDIMRAELELIRCALDESRSQRFLLASESCLPMVPLDQAADRLFVKQKSWINARNTPNNGYSNQQQFEPLLAAGVPSDKIWKADQWCMLTRHHVEAILELPRALREDLWPLFKKVSASDEMYLPTCLALLGEITTTTTSSTTTSTISSSSITPSTTSTTIITKAPTTTNGATTSSTITPSSTTKTISSPFILPQRLTYCHWGDSPKSPETYDGLNESLLRAIKAEGCLFARKFRPGSVSIEAWMAHMRIQDEGGKLYLPRGEDTMSPLRVVGRDGGGESDGGSSGGSAGRKRRREEEGGKANGKGSNSNHHPPIR